MCIWQQTLRLGTALLLGGGVAAGQTALGTAFTYQGRLTDNGSPVTGAFDLRFTLWDSASGGAQVGGTTCADNVTVTDGLITTQVDFGTDAFGGPARWLEIGVRAGGPSGDCSSGSYTILAPRQRLTPVPYAVYAATVPNPLIVTGDHPVAASIFGQNDADAFQSTGVFGLSTASTGNTNGVRGDAASTTGTGVLGFASAGAGVTNGVLGVATSPSGRGVVGWNPSTVGIGSGVYGQADSANGRGVYGEATYANAAGQTFGVLGIANCPAYGSAGVRGVNNAYGQVIGVEGVATNDPGTGVVGRGGITGAYFQANATSGSPITGVYGLGFHRGVYGEAGGGDGLVGYSYSPFTTVHAGVFGDVLLANSLSYAVFAHGPFAASGTKAFVIDHPLDPEHKLLEHYCAEGPDPLLIYRGEATLDARGEAWVQLPNYFEAIAEQPHYSLTCVGGFAPVYIAQRVQAGRFKIAGGTAGLVVDWVVTARRGDAFVRAHGSPVEIEKQGADVGRYLHPELYGQPIDRAIRPPQQAVSIPATAQGGEQRHN